MANLFDFVFSDSSSDEEENNINQRKMKVYRPRRNSDGDNFRDLYRFDRQNFNFLVNHFLFDEREETRGGALNASQKMKIFLRYIGDPGFQVHLYVNSHGYFDYIQILLEIEEKIIKKTHDSSGWRRRRHRRTPNNCL